MITDIASKMDQTTNIEQSVEHQSIEKKNQVVSLVLTIEWEMEQKKVEFWERGFPAPIFAVCPRATKFNGKRVEKGTHRRRCRTTQQVYWQIWQSGSVPTLRGEGFHG